MPSMVWHGEGEDSIPGFGRIKFLVPRDSSTKKHFSVCCILPWEEYQQCMGRNSSLSSGVIYTDEQTREDSAWSEMHAHACWEFCWENSAMTSFPDKWGGLIWAVPVPTAEEASLATEPGQSPCWMARLPSHKKAQVFGNLWASVRIAFGFP